MGKTSGNHDGKYHLIDLIWDMRICIVGHWEVYWEVSFNDLLISKQEWNGGTKPEIALTGKLIGIW